MRFHFLAIHSGIISIPSELQSERLNVVHIRILDDINSYPTAAAFSIIKYEMEWNHK